MKKRLTLTLLLSIIMVFYLGIGTATAQWTAIGPEGGDIINMFNADGTLYLTAGSAERANLYTSVDNGNTWEPLSSPTWPSGTGSFKYAIAKFGNSLFIGCSDHIYRSDDNGISWQIVSDYGGTAFAKEGNTIWAGTLYGILKSEDNGDNWTYTNLGLGYSAISSILISGNEIWAGTDSQEGILYSADNGVTWSTIPGELGGASGLVVSKIGNDIFIGTDWIGVWKLTNGTGTWIKVLDGSSDNYNFKSIVGNSNVIIATGSRVMRSLDGGTTWTDITNNGIDINIWYIAMVASTTNDGLLVGSLGGVYKSIDNGDTWVQSNTGIYSQDILTPALVTIGNDIFSENIVSQIFRSSDEGNTWTEVSSPEINTFSELKPFGAISTTLFSGEFMSTDNGNTWTPHNSPGKVNNLPWIENNGRLITVDQNTGIYISDDNGATWNLSISGISLQTVAYYNLIADGTTLCIGLNANGIESTIYYSNDNGNTWSPSAFTNTVWPPNMVLYPKFINTGTSLIVGTANPGEYYGEGVYRSTDHGVSWERVIPNVGCYSIVASENYVYAVGTQDNTGNNPAMYMSEDDGETWTIISTESDLYYPSLAAYGSYIFVAKWSYLSNTILFSDDAGDNWYEIPQGGEVGDYGISVVKGFSFFNDKVYAGTRGNSLWVRNLSDFELPGQPSAIEGTATPCIGGTYTYSVENISGVTYTWVFPSDWVVLSGQGSNSVTVTVGSESGIILVTPSNMIGNGPFQYLIVAPSLAIDAGVSIVSYPEIICSGTPVTVTATPTEGGDTPVYQWFVNGIENSETDAVLTYVPVNNDNVYAVLTSSLECVTNDPVQSNTIQILVTDAVDVIVSITEDKNDVCTGEIITFTASTTNGGDQPTYNWYVNETNVGDNSATFAYAPGNGDIISLVFTSSEWCVSQNPVTSNAIIAIVNALPEVSWTYTDPTTVCIEDWDPITLTGGLPEGGIYSGTGVSGNIFDQAAAGVGNHVISYTYTDSNNCSAQTQIEFTVDACLGITESDSGWNVYPNPASDNFTIKLNNQNIVDVILYNSMGIKVYDKLNVKAANMTIPVLNLPSGNYILKVTTNHETIVKTIIVK
ncbi:MAG: T9SS type A sorting domain-containing protein [Bacteroidales bacterium]|nr:T9SS type A sorting domain-containing protein [Bacteroidales bacterium]